MSVRYYYSISFCLTFPFRSHTYGHSILPSFPLLMNYYINQCIYYNICYTYQWKSLVFNKNHFHILDIKTQWFFHSMLNFSYKISKFFSSYFATFFQSLANLESNSSIFSSIFSPMLRYYTEMLLILLTNWAL